jgi:hypothetical protein
VEYAFLPISSVVTASIVSILQANSLYLHLAVIYNSHIQLYRLIF